MSSFMNTVDIVGDEALTNSIIDRSIVDFSDDRITIIGNAAFNKAIHLETVNCPNAWDVSPNAFSGCISLKKIDFGGSPTIRSSAFADCTALVALIFRGSGVANAMDYGQLTNTPIAKGTGYIYVPQSLVENYKSSKRWGDYPNQIRALENYTVDGTITGELDDTKT